MFEKQLDEVVKIHWPQNETDLGCPLPLGFTSYVPLENFFQAYELHFLHFYGVILGLTSWGSCEGKVH